MKKTITVMIIVALFVSIFSVHSLVLPDSPVPFADLGWAKTYGGTKDDFAWSVVQTSDGGYALAGYTLSFKVGLANVYFVKTDGSGNMQWNKTYGGIYDEMANSVVQTNDGGYALAGYTSSFSAVDDAYLIKTDSSGNMQWSRTYGGRDLDFANSAVQTSDGGYALAGQTNSFGAGSYDFYLVKVDSSGNMQWSKTYGGANDDEAWSVVQTSDGGYALAGYTKSFGAGGSSFWLVKTDALGNTLWNKTYGGTKGDEASTLVQTSDGGYALAGWTNSYSASSKVYLVKTDGSGNMQWNKTYGGTDSAIAYSIIKASDGGYALAGYKKYLGVGNSEAWLVKTDGSGNMQWSRTYGGMQNDAAWSVVETSDGEYALAGFTNSFGAGGYDFYLVKNFSSSVHDIAVTDLHPLKSVIGRFSSCKLNFTVANQGDFFETFNVSTWAMNALPATTIQNVTIVNMAPHETRTSTIFWNATALAYVNYTLGVAAALVPGEVNSTNNAYWDGSVIVTIPGDLKVDKTVNVLDLILVAAYLNHYASEYITYSLGWYTFNNCDLNSDGNVNVLDLINCAIHMGQHWP